MPSSRTFAPSLTSGVDGSARRSRRRRSARARCRAPSTPPARSPRPPGPEIGVRLSRLVAVEPGTRSSVRSGRARRAIRDSAAIRSPAGGFGLAPCGCASRRRCRPGRSSRTGPSRSRTRRCACRPGAAARPPRCRSCASRSRRASMRLPTKPSQMPTSDADLADLLRERHARSQSTGCDGRFAAHDLEQPHHVRRAEEVQPDDLLGTRRSAARSRRCRASTCWSPGWRPACRCASSLPKTSFFSPISSNTASIDEVGVGESVPVGRRARCLASRCGHLALRRASPASTVSA